MLNRWIGIGRLTRDPELRYTSSGIAVAKFTLAINRKFNREETDFIDIVTWRGLAENCANYLGKGSMVAVEGRLQIRSYEDKNGNKRKAAEITADDVRFLDSKGKGKGQVADKTDDWSDIGKEVSLEDIDISNDEDEIPF
jgi:single-strand DNA-binding protein